MLVRRIIATRDDDVSDVVRPPLRFDEAPTTQVGIHEAAHACVALGLGYEVRSASVVRDDVSEGRVVIETPMGLVDRLHLAPIFLAGIAADHKVNPTLNVGRLLRDRKWADVAISRFAISLAFRDQALCTDAIVNRGLRVWLLKARLLVDAHWRWILVTTEALLDAGELSGAHIQKLKPKGTQHGTQR
jgi:hypothetical protein